MKKYTNLQRIFQPAVGALTAFLLTTATHASTNVFDFNSDPSAILTITRGGDNGTLVDLAGAWIPSGGSPLETGVTDPSTNGYFAITQTTPFETAHGMRSVIIFDDFDNGTVVAGFSFSCDVRVGGGNSSPADGFSLNFARSTDPALSGGPFSGGPDGNPASAPEEGTTTGLAVSFDAFANSGQDPIGLTIKVDGTVLTNIPMPTFNGACADVTSLQTGPNDAGITNLCWQPLVVTMATDGRLSVSYKNTPLLVNFLTTFVPGPGRLILAGRTGGSYQEQDVDNIRVVTFASTAPVVSASTGTPTGFKFNIIDSGFATPDIGTITLTLDGEAVTASAITQTGNPGGGDGITTVSYQNPARLFVPGSTHTNTVRFTGSTFNGVVNATNVFTIPAYLTLTSAQRAPAPVNTTLTGFAGRIHQLAVNRPRTSDLNDVERQLADGFIDPTTGLPFVSLAPIADFTNQVINWAQTQPIGGRAGLFNDAATFPLSVADDPIPGIDPSVSPSTNYAAAEILTILDLQPGVYQVAVNRSEGFKLSAGAEPRDVFQSTLLASSASAGDTSVNLLVTNSGKYPFRLVWANSFSAGNLEFYLTDLGTGQKYLINDQANTSPITSYSDTSALTLPYVRYVSPAQGETGVALNQPVVVKLEDGTAGSVVPGSITLQVNGAGTPVISKTGTQTTVVLSNALTSASANVATLVYSTTLGGPFTHTWTITRPVTLWQILPNERTYLTGYTNDNGSFRDLERGMAYNPTTDHLLVGSRWSSPSVKGIYIVDAATGAHLGELPGVSNLVVGGTICLIRLGVASDGAIYAFNFGSSTPSSNPGFRIYRWASETDSAPVVAFQGYPMSGIDTRSMQWGKNVIVRGAGTNTQILADTRFSLLSLFTTLDGTNFTAIPINATNRAPADAASAGLAWGSGDTFWGKNNGAPLYQWQLNIASSNLTGIRTNTSLNSKNFANFSLSEDFNHLAGILPQTGADAVVLYDLSNPDSPVLQETWPWPADNNQGAVYGNAYIRGNRVLVLNTDNGMAAFAMPTAPALSLRKEASSLILSWPAAAMGFALEESETLSPANWTAANVTYSRTGSDNRVTIQPGSDSKFYRLKK